MAFKLVKKSLASFVTEAIAAYKSSGEKMHIAVVSALHNQATSGDTTLINRIYENLRSNDQQALRLYVGRNAVANGLVLTGANESVETLETETKNKMVEVGCILDFKKGKFVTTKNPETDAAKMMAKLLEERFLNPDGKRDKMVFERNNFTEHKLIGDAEVLKNLLKQTNEALNNTANNKTITLTSTVRARLEKIRDMLTINHNQATLNEG